MQRVSQRNEAIEELAVPSSRVRANNYEFRATRAINSQRRILKRTRETFLPIHVREEAPRGSERGGGTGRSPAIIIAGGTERSLKETTKRGGREVTNRLARGNGRRFATEKRKGRKS